MDQDDREVGFDTAPSESSENNQEVPRERLDQMIAAMKARSMLAGALAALEEEKGGRRLVGVGLHRRNRIVRCSGGATDLGLASTLDVSNSLRAHTIQVS